MCTCDDDDDDDDRGGLDTHGTAAVGRPASSSNSSSAHVEQRLGGEILDFGVAVANVGEEEGDAA